MAIYIALNELSLKTPASHPSIARQWMYNLMQTVRSINAETKSTSILLTQYDFHSTLLATDYNLHRWLNDSGVDKEERRFIKSLSVKTPFSEGVSDPKEVQLLENNSGGCEFLYQGKPAIGLGVAYMLDTIAVSILSEACWDYSYLDLDVISLEEDDKEITIIHTSRKEHVQSHIDWLKTRLHSNIDGQALWDQKDDLFPNLQFCDSVKKQLQGLSIGNLMINPIKKRLLELQNYAESWLEGSFNPKQLSKATPESETTLQKYAQERTFICPDGEKHIFSWHIRLTPLAWRIYFYPKQPSTIIIGYIGEHLPTTKFN